jgi:hypothetical protein
MSAEHFKSLVAQHDLSFMYSPRHEEQQAGSESMARIKEAAKLLPEGEARRIWDEMIDATQPAGQRQRWYWH